MKRMKKTAERERGGCWERTLIKKRGENKNSKMSKRERERERETRKREKDGRGKRGRWELL